MSDKSCALHKTFQKLKKGRLGRQVFPFYPTCMSEEKAWMSWELEVERDKKIKLEPHQLEKSFFYKIYFTCNKHKEEEE